MKVFLFSIATIVGFAFAAWIMSLLRSLTVFVIPPLASYPVATFLIACGMLFGLCLLAGRLIEHCAVEYPYDDRM